jgi:methylated-DNA-[protein]-cysteine S-methyltransferase
MKSYYKSPIGIIRIESSNKGISGLVFVDNIDNEVDNMNEMASLCISQLDQYFHKQRKQFDLQLDLQGSEFQKRVWNELLNIPFGNTVSYKNLALKLGDLKAIRAVGTANGANPVSIIIPCHRVIGSDGSLTGYAGGLWRKKWLLEHESGEEMLF